MSEWSKEHAWKACIGATLSGVQIPFSPPTLFWGASRCAPPYGNIKITIHDYLRKISESCIFFYVKVVDILKRKMIEVSTKNITFDRGYDEFIFNCRARNLRPATIQFYDNSIRSIYKFIDPRIRSKWI